MNCSAERNRLTDPKIKFMVAEGETWRGGDGLGNRN